MILMSKKSLSFAILLVLVISAIFINSLLEPELEPGVEEKIDPVLWGEDLDALVSGIHSRHPDPFSRVGLEIFNNSVSELRNKLPELTHDEVIVEFMTLVASLQDGHTMLFPLQSKTEFDIFPLRLYIFSDGVFITDAIPEYSHFIGSQIIEVNSHTVEEVIEKLKPTISHDNEFTQITLLPVRLLIPNLLKALGFIDTVDRPNYVIRYNDGSTEVFNPALYDYDSYKIWMKPNRTDLAGLRTSFDEITFLSGLPQGNSPNAPEYLKQKDEVTFRYYYLENNKTLYFQYNFIFGSNPNGLSITTFIDELTNFVENNDIEKIVVDVRHNPGGNVNTYGQVRNFLSTIASNGSIQNYLVIGRNTFSAATIFANDIATSDLTILVGEETGGSPNLFGDTGVLLLPNSRLQVEISTNSYTTGIANDTRTSLVPDHYLTFSSSHYFNLEDPYLDAILNF